VPEYLAPGVYVEETSFRPKTIEGVSTSTAGFVGPARTGPTSGEPRLLTSFADFQRIYGGLEGLEFNKENSSDTIKRKNYLAYAVRAFFEEGGQRCYVARVYDALSNDNGISEQTSGDLTFSARYPGSAGDMRVIIRAINSRNASSGSGTGLPGVGPGDTVFADPGQNTPLANLGAGVGFYDYINDSSGNGALATEDSSGNTLSTPISTLTPNDRVYPLRVRVLVQREEKRPSGGVEFGAEEVVGEYKLNPETNGALIDGLHKESPSGDPALTPVALTTASNTQVNTGYGYADKIFSNPITEPFSVPVNVDGLDTDVSWYKITFTDSGIDVLDADLTDTLTPQTAEVQTGVDNGKPFIEVKIRDNSVKGGKGTLINAGVAIREFSSASVSIDSFETAKTLTGNLSSSNAGDGTGLLPDRFEIGDLKEFVIRMTDGGDGKEPKSYKTGGSSGGPPNTPEGFDALEDLENVSIVAAPGYTEISDTSAALNVQSQLIGHCESMKYRIAVLDTQEDSTVKNARDWRGNIDSTHAAMYHPWITIFDPLTRSELNVPPSGHVAGLYARNDIQDGVHKAPANMVVRSAVGFEKRINKRQQDVLNPEGVNCFRFFEGRGNRLWGARIATSDNEYKYVNIRRYLAYLERSIDQGTQVFVFENNGTDLWRNVRRTIGSFLKNEWRSDRLMGTTPEQAYFVKCDRSTMTQNDIDNGRLICEIGVALFRPAEFVIFRIGQKLLSDTG